MSPAVSGAVGRMQDKSALIIVEQARLDGVLEALRDLAGVTRSVAALDAARARFVARHATQAAAEGWVA